MKRAKKNAPSPLPVIEEAPSPSSSPPAGIEDDPTQVAEIAADLIASDLEEAQADERGRQAEFAAALAALPIERRIAARISLALATTLDELAKAEGHPNEGGGITLDPSRVTDVCRALLEGVARDFQELGIVSLDEATEALAIGWTTPRG